MPLSLSVILGHRTTPRGATREEDAEYEQSLTGNAKILHEHDVVVRMLRDALADVCDHLAVDPALTDIRGDRPPAAGLKTPRVSAQSDRRLASADVPESG
ncbi:chorismate-binding protein [Streptomyces sp. NPDC051098]|uniref:chorismate-binding protein n=1 Tax=Streptomyces sp. NPDC051098 TaxID=3155411 RepID=UPI003429D213